VCIPRRWAHVTRQHPEYRRLAGSVDTEQTEAFALVNANRNPVYRQMSFCRQSFCERLFKTTTVQQFYSPFQDNSSQPVSDTIEERHIISTDIPSTPNRSSSFTATDRNFLI